MQEDSFLLILLQMYAEKTPLLTFLSNYQKNQPLQKIAAIPLEWEHLATDVISKQLTKLNNPHPYRIHYLGPRPHSTLVFHKKQGRAHNQEPRETTYPSTQQNLYGVNMQKIVNPTLIGVRTQEPHYKASLFYRAFEGMNPTLDSQQEFLFNGAFQSGNLDCVIKPSPNEFDLFLRIDSNTRGHTGWYFFSIKNGCRKEKVRINICNLKKPSLLYNQGMKPFTFSRKKHQNKGTQWQQTNEYCNFQQSQLRYTTILQGINTSSFYKLTFDYQFQFENDQVFFSYCVPYTYSQLQQDIRLYNKSPFVQELTLGRTLSGLQIPLLHITNHKGPVSEDQKKVVIVAARVHPAESNGSHVAKGLIQFLISLSKQAQELRNHLHFFVVPMINPDGVVFGNTRTSAAGKDLNRQFLQPQPQIYPECYQLKSFVVKLKKRKEITMYLDLHGHSRRKNTFIYGPNYFLQQLEYYQCRIFPKLIQKINPIFRFHACQFVITQDKRTTARAVMLHQLKIPFVYTVESSIGLYFNHANPSKVKTFPFESSDWEQMGVSICRSIGTFNSILEDMKTQEKQRKNERDKRKSSTASNSRHSKRLSEIQFDFVNLTKKQGSNSILNELIRQIKSSPIIKNNEDDLDSDDHDEDENLPSFKLKQFKMHITSARPREKRAVKDEEMQQLDKDFIFVPKLSRALEYKNQDPSKVNAHKMGKTSVRLSRQKASNTTKIQKTIDVGTFNSKRQYKGSFSAGNSTQFIKKTADYSSRYHFKNITVCKPRYSLVTKNLYPVEDTQEVLSIPKSLQMMKKDMKKGRILIHHLQQSNMRMGKKEQNPKKQKKGPFIQTDALKLRMGGARRQSVSQFKPSDYHPSTTNISEHPQKQIECFPLEQPTFSPLDGLQVDNLAMKITTFKRR